MYDYQNEIEDDKILLDLYNGTITVDEAEKRYRLLGLAPDKAYHAARAFVDLWDE